MTLEILVEDPSLIKGIKTQLEQCAKFVKPISKDKQSSCTIIKTNFINEVELRQIIKLPNDIIIKESTHQQDKLLSDIPHDIIGFTKQFYQDKLSSDQLNIILNHTPLKYSIYPPMLLLNNSITRSFDNPVWQGVITSEYYSQLLTFLSSNQNKLNYIALNKPIEENDNILRKPDNIQVLYPFNVTEEIWCEVKQNGIWQCWNPMVTMFSRGNIKEKKRIIDTFKDIEGNDIIDLYCGIGYFSLSYLFMKCRNLFGFELNHWSIEAFKRGLIKNHGFNRNPDNNNGNGLYSGVHLYNENNEMSDQRILEYRQSQGNELPFLRIRHINMGLLPSSEQGYPVALTLLSHHHDWRQIPVSTLHVHENASVEEIDNGIIQERVISKLSQIQQHSSFHYNFTLTHLEKIKTFAPDVWHIVLDIDVTLSSPSSSSSLQ